MTAPEPRHVTVLRAPKPAELTARINLARSILGHRTNADGSLPAEHVAAVLRVLEGGVA